MKEFKRQLIKFTLWIGLLTGTVIFYKAWAQEKYLDKNGVLIFEASEKVFEEVKAVNKATTVI